MKILNLYAGIGGNRKLWGEDHEVTAVEYDPIIAKLYKENFPNDTVLVEDAHAYLLKMINEKIWYDFVWTSPPCPSHSKIRNIAGVGRGQNDLIYPAMELWQEIIVLKRVIGLKRIKHFVAENVELYYGPVLNPRKVGRHYIWSDFYISPYPSKQNVQLIDSTIPQLQEQLGIFNTQNKKYLRNCVDPKTAFHIFDAIPGNRKRNILL